MDLTNISFSILRSAVITLISIAIIIVIIVGYLMYRKRKMFKYPCLLIRQVAPNKIAFFSLKGGWLGREKLLGGLITRGENQFELTDKRIVYNISDEDLIDIDGKKGFIIFQDPTDPQLLTPINSMQVKNKEFILDIAPADFRDTSVLLYRKTKHESMGLLEKVMPYVGVIVAALICLIAIILVIQFAQRSMKDVIDFMMQLKGSMVIGGSSNAPA